MIPIWTEPSETIREFGNLVEDCIFCGRKTRTWHENTNNPICVGCADTHKVADIKRDWGSKIRYKKRTGTFDREDSVRAN